MYNKYYISPEKILFLIGINETIILIILTIILYFTKVLDDEISLNCWKIVMSLLYLIVSFAKQYIALKFVYLISVQSVSF